MLSKTKFLLAAGAASLALATPAFAQDAECYQNDSYFVIGQQRTDEVGTSFIVKTLDGAAAPACSFEAGADDFVLDDVTDPLWYAGLAGKYLVLTRSTGPDGDVVIYDLASRKAVVDKPADDEVIVDDAMVMYWERTGEATAQSCPEFAENEANGLGSVIAEEAMLDVATGEISKTGETRCSSTQ